MKRNSSHGSRGDSNYSSLHPEPIISLQNNPSVFTGYVRVIQPLDTIRRLSCFHSPNGNHRSETVVPPPPPSQQRREVAHSRPKRPFRPALRRWRKRGLRGSAAGAKVHRLLVWKTYDSARSISSARPVNLARPRFVSEPPRESAAPSGGRVNVAATPLGPSEPRGPPARTARERRNWVNINGPRFSFSSPSLSNVVNIFHQRY